MQGSCCGGSGQGSNMACCRGCGSPMGKGHALTCCIWFFAKIFLLLGVVAAAGAVYLQYYDQMWLWYDATHLYLKAIVLLLLSIVSRMCYRDRKKMSMMGMMSEGCGSGCGEGSCGGCGDEKH